MKNIKSFNSFNKINEIVYLFKTMFEYYKFIVNNNSNTGDFIIGIEGNEYKISVQQYGNDNMEFIFKEPSDISVMDDSIYIFESIINDILYILNKNELSYKFELIEIMKDKGMPVYDAIIKSNTKMKISDLERIVTTTKIINKKIKNINDFDKLIYQTK